MVHQVRGLRSRPTTALVRREGGLSLRASPDGSPETHLCGRVPDSPGRGRLSRGAVNPRALPALQQNDLVKLPGNRELRDRPKLSEKCFRYFWHTQRDGGTSRQGSNVLMPRDTSAGVSLKDTQRPYRPHSNVRDWQAWVENKAERHPSKEKSQKRRRSSNTLIFPMQLCQSGQGICVFAQADIVRGKFTGHSGSQ